MLRSAPSFSIYSDSADGVREEDLLTGNEETLERTVTIGGKIEALSSGDFSFVRPSSMVSIEEEDAEEEKNERFSGIKSMGFKEEDGRRKGLNVIQDLGLEKEEEKEKGFNVVKDLDIGKEKEEKEEGFNGIEILGVKEEHQNDKGFDQIKKSGFELEEKIEPPASPPMYLAAGLGIDGYDLNVDEIKIDLPSFDGRSGDIEEYYKKMLDDFPLHPLLLQNYAQFLESKGDLRGAEDYYHRCTLVEPDDGEILANYAKLVWRLHQDQTKASHYFECAARASPQDSNVLAAYANFLWEVDDDGDEAGGNSKEAEQVQSNGTTKVISSLLPADSDNGEKMCEYAKLQWDIHHNRNRAIYYFEKAVEASPEDSRVLAAYARFLWDAEEETDEAEDGAATCLAQGSVSGQNATKEDAQVVYEAS